MIECLYNNIYNHTKKSTLFFLKQNSNLPKHLTFKSFVFIVKCSKLYPPNSKYNVFFFFYFITLQPVKLLSCVRNVAGSSLENTFLHIK